MTTYPATGGMRALARRRMAQARTGLTDGTPAGRPYLRGCGEVHRSSGAKVLFSRDTGHHTSGWFKNPQYERCWHLSLSFVDPHGGGKRDPESGEAEAWVELFYGPDQRFVWEESPHSPEGQSAGVRHYRVFCDEHWQPIVPRGEVYSRDMIEKGWRSWSDRHSDLVIARR